MSDYQPPFHITGKITSLIGDICEQIGRIAILHKGEVSPRLRRANRIRTIHSSLAIEQNTLSLEQVTAILDGKRILGNPVEIKEVLNAYEAYELMLALDPASPDDLLKAHRLMMQSLIPEDGKYRSGGVGVFSKDKLIHLAPPAHLVPEHMQNLFAWYQKSDLHPLIRSAVFHYEFEFIHPFTDGNGRMGRLWHTLLLGRWKEIFFWLPVEDLIRERQQEYYDALSTAGKEADSTGFAELMLEILRDSLEKLAEAGESNQASAQVSDQVTAPVTGQVIVPVSERNQQPVERLLSALGNDTLPAAEIMARLGLSHKATFRKNYLNPALEQERIERTIPDRPNSRNQRYRKCR